MAIARPLLFASLDEDVAAARGVPVRLLGFGFLVLVGAAAAESTQVVGALLILGLLAAPAGAATRLTARPLLRARPVRDDRGRQRLDRPDRQLRHPQNAAQLRHPRRRHHGLPACHRRDPSSPPATTNIEPRQPRCRCGARHGPGCAHHARSVVAAVDNTLPNPVLAPDRSTKGHRPATPRHGDRPQRATRSVSSRARAGLPRSNAR